MSDCVQSVEHTSVHVRVRVQRTSASLYATNHRFFQFFRIPPSLDSHPSLMTSVILGELLARPHFFAFKVLSSTTS